MVDTSQASGTAVQQGSPVKLQRLHHLAYTTYDMAATRHFYEDVIGMPLAQTWVEGSDGTGPMSRHYVHCFFGLADGGAIAYFEHHGREKPEHVDNSWGHIALKTDAESQAAIIGRLEAEGYKHRVTDHGYCVSMYCSDPNGLNLEFTVDADEIDDIVAYQSRVAHSELERWQSGDMVPNNSWRPKDH